MRHDVNGGRERFPDLRDVDLDELPRRGRWRSVPYRVDKLVDTAGSTSRDEERAEQPSLLGSERDRPALGHDLERAEHAYFDSRHVSDSVCGRSGE